MTALVQRLRGAGGVVRSGPVPLLSTLGAVAATVAFMVGMATGGVAPSSPLGLGLGVAAALSLLAVMLYSARRAMPAVRRLGPTRTYLQVHLWGGTLFFLLFLYHTGFGLPSGGMVAGLWLLSLWVVLTGAVGLFLQRAVPQVLNTTSSFEVHLERIPGLVDELRARAEAKVAESDPRVRSWFQKRVAPVMAGPRVTYRELFRSPAAHLRGTREVELLKCTLEAEDAAVVDEVQGLRVTKHEMDVHYTLQRVLRGWLVLHLPAAVALLALVVLHVFFILYF
ncbi:MAG: hypothetical protein WEB88_13775 [Gemmatimonadota bacterium]